jgi:hypothetical protein
MQVTLTLSEDLVGQLQNLPNPDLFVSETVKAALLRHRARPLHQCRIRLPTFLGDGLQPGVNLNDGRQLRELMDEDGLARC